MLRYRKKVAALGFLVFMALWLVGAIQGLTLPFPPPLPISIAYVSGDSEAFSRRQSINNLHQVGLIETPLQLVLDHPDINKIQIYEKRATLASASSEFSADQLSVRAAIKEHKAEIFAEKNSGIEPQRRLTLEIGVHPDKFDSLAEQLQKIGKLSSINVEQKDRTGEFRKLSAQRQSLKKHHAEIVKLQQKKELSFDESLKLLQKIYDIEKELESLNVQFGDLLGKEAFYHVHLTLVEHQRGDIHDRTYTVPQRIFHAFLWAVAWWFGVALAAALAIATVVSVWILRQ